jgi:hypothetical protein
MSDKGDHLPTKKSSKTDVDAFLKKVARTPVSKAPGQRGRLIFGMDATASRQPMWDRAAKIQGEMFTETAALGGLDLQLAYYRGFGEFKVSNWVNDGEKLLKLMTSVFCLAGETQIGKLLSHAIAESKKQKVNALVFIGDCVEEDVDKLGNLAGELGILGVPVFMFQEGDDAVATFSFQQIAKLTGGACCRFDASSAHVLKELLGAVAVYAAGGRPALEDMSRKRGGEVLRLVNLMKEK